MIPPWRKNVARLLGIAAAFVVLSCGDRASPTGPQAIAPRGGASKTIFDGAHSGNQDVWFLPPMVASPVGKPGYGNAFDPGLSVAVRIKDVTTNTYIVGAPSAVTVSLVDQLYQANWDTKNPALSLTDIYRVEVQVSGKTVAYADIDVVSGGELKNLSTGDAIPLVDGRTLPIKVRIEQGLVACANPATCTSQTVPAAIASDVTIATPDNKNWITFRGGTTDWNNQHVAAVVTIEDVSSQFGNSAAGCGQGITNLVVYGHCLQITTNPAITLSRPAVVCMVPTSAFQGDWELLKYGTNEQTKYLADPQGEGCPTLIASSSTVRSSNPLLRLASAFSNALRRLVTPTLAYAFDLGVGGMIGIGDGFSFFAPGMPAAMTKVSGDNQIAAPGALLPNNPTVKILKTHHHDSPSPVTGAHITCTVTGGGGSLAGTAAETPAGSGVYTCPSWTLGTTAGTNTLQVTADVLDPTVAGGSVTFTATGGGSPTISALSLTSTNVVLDGFPVNYTATLSNPSGVVQPGVLLQGYLVQGSASRAAGGSILHCPVADGNLPIAGCTQTSIVSASNANGGTGTLVPGAANFVLELRQNNGDGTSLLDSKTIAVTLAALPNPVLALKNFDPESNSTTFNLTVTNRSVYPNTLFNPSPNLPACGANASAARTWVDIYDGVTNAYIYGFCSFGSSSDLDLIWFSIPTANALPASVYIKMTDRLTGNVYTSNTLTLNTAPVLALKNVQTSTDPAGTYYNLTVTNRTIYAPQLFENTTGVLDPCGGTGGANVRTWVTVYDASSNNQLMSFCGFGSPSDLDLPWFFVPTVGTPPAAVYLVMHDRLLTKDYRSNNLTISP